MRVVAFTGMPGAGKSEAVAEARRRGLPIVTMGDFVRAATSAQGLPLTDENLGRIATQMRRERGADWWAQRTCDEIERRHRGSRLVVIDGVRTLEEVEAFRRRLGAAFQLVAVETSLEMRADRLRRRGRPDDGTTVEQVRERDEREVGWGIDRAIAAADETLRNVQDLDGFRREVVALFDRLTRSA